METFQDFLEALIADGAHHNLSNSGLLRLIRIYEANDLAVPTILTTLTTERGLILT